MRMPKIEVLRQPEGKLGCRLSGNNTVSEVHTGSVAEAAGLRVGLLVTSINGKPTTREGAAVDALQQLISQSVFKITFDVTDEPPAAKSKEVGKRKAAELTNKEPAKEPKAKEPKAKEPKVATSDPLGAAQAEQRQKLLAKQRKQLADLKEKHATELAAFDRKCEQEQAAASGQSTCFSCGAKVAGKVEKPKYSWQGLPAAVAKSTCCYCQLARKCAACEWVVACAYFPDEHGFCADCECKANICLDCDGGCIKCQMDNGCCSTNGGHPR